MRMPFGKHRDEEVEDLPEDYLRWLVANVDLFEPLRSAVYEALGKADPQKQLPAEIQIVYRKVSKRWHPDNGGHTAAMQAINEFYDELKKKVKLIA